MDEQVEETLYECTIAYDKRQENKRISARNPTDALYKVIEYVTKRTGDKECVHYADIWRKNERKILLNIEIDWYNKTLVYKLSYLGQPKQQGQGESEAAKTKTYASIDTILHDLSREREKR